MATIQEKLAESLTVIEKESVERGGIGVDGIGVFFAQNLTNGKRFVFLHS